MSKYINNPLSIRIEEVVDNQIIEIQRSSAIDEDNYHGMTRLLSLWLWDYTMVLL